MSYALREYAGHSRPAATGKDVSRELAGLRVQLMKALSHVHHGSPLVYRLRVEHIESAAQRMLGEYLIPDCNWLGDNVEPLIVPGTVCPEAIGALLMHFGWISPVNNGSTGYTHRFVLSETGEKALESARAWWSSLSWFQKTWLYVTE